MIDVRQNGIIPNGVKINRDLIHDGLDFFGAAFQQVIRSFWVGTDGGLIHRTFMVANAATEDEEGKLITVPVTMEVVPIEVATESGLDQLSFTIDDVEEYPTTFALVKIEQDLPNHAITFNIKWDQVEDETQWSVTTMDIKTMEQVRLEGNYETMLTVVSDTNPQILEDDIDRVLGYLFGYGLRQDTVHLPLAVVPTGNRVVIDGVTYQVLDEMLLNETTGDLKSITDYSALQLVEWPVEGHVTFAGITSITTGLTQFVDALLEVNRKHVDFNLDDMDPIIEQCQHIHDALHNRRSGLDNPSYVGLVFTLEQIDSRVEVRVSGGPHTKDHECHIPLLNIDVVGNNDWDDFNQSLVDQLTGANPGEVININDIEVYTLPNIPVAIMRHLPDL